MSTEFQDCSVNDLTDRLRDLFYESTDTFRNRKAEANRIMDELKIRFRETGI